MSHNTEITLYIWPHSWSLPSFDVDSLACVLYLQLLCANGQQSYALVECTDPDVSPTCSLPFLRHEGQEIGTARSILRYLQKLQGEEAGDDIASVKRTAWSAYVDSRLKDLTNAVLYANPENYRVGVHKVLATLLPVPARYYLPRRLREEIRATLEPAGMWNLQQENDENDGMEEKKRPFDKPKTIVDEKDKIINEAFGKEKLLEKARETFDLLNPLLAHHAFFLSKQVTPLDCQVAACILLLRNAQTAKNPIPALLDEFYPKIAEHSDRILSLAFPADEKAKAQVTVGVASHANPLVQLGRAVHRVIKSVSS